MAKLCGFLIVVLVTSACTSTEWIETESEALLADSATTNSLDQLSGTAWFVVQKDGEPLDDESMSR